MSNSVRITAADFNGNDWDGSPFDPAPCPEWLMSALTACDISVSNAHSTDYAVWNVKGVGEAWPGDRIIRTADGGYVIQKEQA